MSNFYSDHWVNIEDERLARYETMFQFRSDQEPIIESLDLGTANRVLDFGCGPGFLAMEIARRCPGEVIGVDLNAEFVRRANRRAADEALSNVQFITLEADTLPIDDATVDRILCKNVLEYVPDLSKVLAELKRVLVPGGQIQIIDSDWGFVIVEPWGKKRTDAFFEAASAAFREPQIGRKLAGALAASGYQEIDVQLRAGVDRKGGGINVLLNMMSYIRQFETVPGHELDDMLRELEAGKEDGSYMFVLPQFFVSARR